MTQTAPPPNPEIAADGVADGPDGGRGEVVAELAGVSKTFRDFWLRPRVKAVQDLDLTMRRGEVLGLLGPNGAGKSTTIKMLLGLLYPDKGRVAVLGKPATDVNLKGRIGYLPEDSHLYRFLNAEETLDFYGRLFKLPAEERGDRVEKLLDMVGLRAARYRQVGEMSKGMKRRVALAQALINDPDILILDEPTAGMDPLATRDVKDLILALKKRGKTVLLCTHLLGDVEDVCDRLAIMYGGKLRTEGRTADLLTDPERQTLEIERLVSLDEPGAVDQIEQAIARGERHVLTAKPAKRRMDELFLDVIEKANKAGDATTGAALGGAVADFLADEQTGDVVLDDLTKPDAAPRPVEPTPAPTADETPTARPPVDEEPDAAVLEQVSPTPAPPPPPAEPARPLPEQDADDDLLGSLVDGDKRGTGQ